MGKKSLKEKFPDRPEVRGLGRSTTNNPGAEVCPICWKKDWVHAGYHWEIMAEIWKCTACAHHAVRDLSPTGLKHVESDDLFSNSYYKLYEKETSKIIKDLFVDKFAKNSEVNILIPILKDSSIITHIERQFGTRARPKPLRMRRAGVNSRIKNVGRSYYSLGDITSKTFIETMNINESVIFDMVQVVPRFQSLATESNRIAEGIIRSAEKNANGKFDLIILPDILSQVIDPDPIIDAVLKTCDYFIATVPRNSTQDFKVYSAYMAEKVFRATNNMTYEEAMKNYPLVSDHDKVVQKFCKRQLQFFSEHSLDYLFYLKYKALKNAPLPKGRYRSFKVGRIEGISQDLIVAHNIPEKLYTAL